jgi:hypothetical protein
MGKFMRQPTDGKKKKMSAQKIYWAWFVALALLILLVGGCNGVLYEKQKDNGQVERLLIDQDGGWDSYNIHPRYYSQNPKDLSDFSIMLKNERTF